MNTGELEPTEKPFLRSRGRGWGVQCNRIKRNGVRCECWAIVGGFVCMTHGGRLPTVRASANARMRALLPAAVKVIEESLESPKDSVRFRAARYVIRYSGITPQNIDKTESRGERAALGPGAPTPKPVDDEIETLLTQLTGSDDEE